MVSSGRIQTLLTYVKPKKGMQCYHGFSIGYIRLNTRLPMPLHGHVMFPERNHNIDPCNTTYTAALDLTTAPELWEQLAHWKELVPAYI